MPALVIVDENDILRDQGEAYADKLREADVPTACVRVNGTMHDFTMLNALRDTESTRAAMDLTASVFRRAFGVDSRWPPELASAETRAFMDATAGWSSQPCAGDAYTGRPTYPF
jgi:acetyl esterase/lipase